MFFPFFGCLVLENLISEMLTITNSKISSTPNMTIVLANITLFQRFAFDFFYIVPSVLHMKSCAWNRIILLIFQSFKIIQPLVTR
jgi:hypothetical protein